MRMLLPVRHSCYLSTKLYIIEARAYLVEDALTCAVKYVQLHSAVSVWYADLLHTEVNTNCLQVC
jgi:hypothetical protein